jgi:putative oxidoreductase
MQLHHLPPSSVPIRDSLAPFVLRVTLGVMIFPHGAQKLLGWFGGYGFTGTMGYFTGTAGVPWILGFLVILAEFFGGFMLIAGLATRFTAASLAIIMGGAAWQVRTNGFFMNWFGNQKGEGIEFFLLAIGIAVSLAFLGAGQWSLDSGLARRLQARAHGNKSAVETAPPSIGEHEPAAVRAAQTGGAK